MSVKGPSYNLITQFSIPLIIGIILALFARNIFPEVYGNFIHLELLTIGDISLSVKHVMNDIFMAFMFGLAAKELVEAFGEGGCLRNPKSSVNPILATIAGTLVPASLYYGLTRFLIDDVSVVSGAAIPIATDIAFAWLGARILFGAKHPAVQYLLLLAILDDAIGMFVLAIFYPNPELALQLSWLWLTGLGMAIATLFRLYNVHQWFLYIALGGTLSWLGLLQAGLHPALALVLIVPFIPAPEHDTGLYKTNREETSPMQDFEHNIKPIIDFGLFFFALVNAGVPITGASFTLVTIIIFSSALVGKVIGIFGMVYILDKIGLPLPQGITLGNMKAIALLAGVNITVSLFLADRAFGGTEYEYGAKMGALLTLIVPFGIMMYKGWQYAWQRVDNFQWIDERSLYK